MTDKHRTSLRELIAAAPLLTQLNFELKKTSLGAVALISGIVSISEYSREHIVLLSHSGRLSLIGERMEISVLENRTVEIYGRILEVDLSYGKA